VAGGGGNDQVSSGAQAPGRALDKGCSFGPRPGRGDMLHLMAGHCRQQRLTQGRNWPVTAAN
jgi:hypothetical protein